MSRDMVVSIGHGAVSEDFWIVIHEMMRPKIKNVTLTIWRLENEQGEDAWSAVFSFQELN